MNGNHKIKEADCVIWGTDKKSNCKVFLLH